LIRLYEEIILIKMKAQESLSCVSKKGNFFSDLCKSIEELKAVSAFPCKAHAEPFGVYLHDLNCHFNVFFSIRLNDKLILRWVKLENCMTFISQEIHKLFEKIIWVFF